MSKYSSQIKYTTISKQQGLSIVELMVALVLSLVVMFVTTSIYVSNKQTYRFLDQYSLLQENGRFAIFFLREHILQAGFPRQANVNPFPSVPPNDSTVSVQFRSAVDCRNQPAGTPPTTINTFAIDTTNQQLTCNTLPLVDGIETMQVMYGEDFGGDGIADTYINRSGVTSWGNVVSVRIALLAQGQQNSLDVAQNITYNLLGTAVARNDRTPRRVFTTTIPLRNRNKTII